MPKLTLNLETLDVQSFEALDARQAGRAELVLENTNNTSPACCYTFGCGDSINQAC